MSKKLVPNIRFKGFDKEWENKSFKSLTYPTGEKNKENKEYDSYSITNESGFVPQNEKFSKGGTMKNADKSLYYIAQPNTFAYNPARINVGSIGYQNLSFPVIVSSLYVLFKTTDECHDDFLFHWFKSELFSQQVLLTQEGGVRLYFFYDKLKRCTINLPQKNEQKLISSFLDLFNKEIKSVQTKLDKLYALKKTMLVKMFPQGDALVPEIRLKGFKEEWKCSPAKEIFKSVADKNHPDLPVLSASQEFGMIKRDEVGKIVAHDKSSEATYKRVLPGQFVIHLRSFQGGFAHSAYEGITSPAYTVMDFKEKELHDDMYWKYVFMTKMFIIRLETVTYGIRDGRSISFADYSSLEMKYPDVREQAAIGQYFQTLDKQLRLYEQKLSKLKNLKSAFLKNMFV